MEATNLRDWKDERLDKYENARELRDRCERNNDTEGSQYWQGVMDTNLDMYNEVTYLLGKYPYL